MTFSQEVQRFFQSNYVIPARQRGQATVEVKAGEIHSKLGWSRRVPVVCAALSSQKLQRNVGVRLKEKNGPPSGQSPTVIFRYEILDREASSAPGVTSPPPKRGLLASYGVAAHLYRQVGGGDAFLKAERENFGSVVPQIDDAGAEEQANGGMNP
jgi:hypothetical protein